MRSFLNHSCHTFNYLVRRSRGCFSLLCPDLCPESGVNRQLSLHFSREQKQATKGHRAEQKVGDGWGGTQGSGHTGPGQERIRDTLGGSPTEQEGGIDLLVHVFNAFELNTYFVQDVILASAHT